MWKFIHQSSLLLPSFTTLANVLLFIYKWWIPIYIDWPIIHAVRLNLTLFRLATYFVNCLSLMPASQQPGNTNQCFFCLLTTLCSSLSVSLCLSVSLSLSLSLFLAFLSLFFACLSFPLSQSFSFSLSFSVIYALSQPFDRLSKFYIIISGFLWINLVKSFFINSSLQQSDQSI